MQDTTCQHRNLNRIYDPESSSQYKCDDCGQEVDWKVGQVIERQNWAAKGLGIFGDITDWRKEHLARLEYWESKGFEVVEWMSANDEFTCSKCHERDGKQFTISEMRAMLETEFCCPKDRDQGCRCCINICSDLV